MEQLNLKKRAVWLIFLFGSMYHLEQLFSRMRYTKSKNRSAISDDHLEDCLRLATTSLKPDIDHLMQEKQWQPSH